MRNLTSKLPQFVTVFNMQQRKTGAQIRPEAGGQRAGRNPGALENSSSNPDNTIQSTGRTDINNKDAAQ